MLIDEVSTQRQMEVDADIEPQTAYRNTLTFSIQFSLLRIEDGGKIF
jgi:hypothetical protein